MNIQITVIKKKIIELKKERDELFCMLVEVDYDTQTILLESIIDLTDTIDKHKNNLKRLLHENY